VYQSSKNVVTKINVNDEIRRSSFGHPRSIGHLYGAIIGNGKNMNKKIKLAKFAEVVGVEHLISIPRRDKMGARQ